ncbi:hypothetical protein [Nocardia sp. NBC_01329]|uniref:hypothetical protein n=1 Tax=Nocardia sp. NBC_01329 TaxID=2903594 RepID=UPI002E107A82|nr:hypothetical protein OG405_14805 [Nocardia sp. NBC_01329]
MTHKVAAVAVAGILAAFLSAGTASSQPQASSEPQQQQQPGEDGAENAGEPGGKAEGEKGRGRGKGGKGKGKGGKDGGE